jgi:predicted enzyme related to lactoylglutathione lyase
VGRSVAFYQQLGFSLVNELVPDGAAEPTWAYLEAGKAQLMVGLAGEPVISEQQAVLFYLYVDDVAAVHAQWTDEGLSAGPISYPFYCPKGEFRLVDPDGYCLMIAHT